MKQDHGERSEGIKRLSEYLLHIFLYVLFLIPVLEILWKLTVYVLYHADEIIGINEIAKLPVRSTPYNVISYITVSDPSRRSMFFGDISHKIISYITCFDPYNKTSYILLVNACIFAFYVILSFFIYLNIIGKEKRSKKTKSNFSFIASVFALNIFLYILSVLRVKHVAIFLTAYLFIFLFYNYFKIFSLEDKLPPRDRIKVYVPNIISRTIFFGILIYFFYFILFDRSLLMVSEQFLSIFILTILVHYLFFKLIEEIQAPGKFVKIIGKYIKNHRWSVGIIIYLLFLYLVSSLLFGGIKKIETGSTEGVVILLLITLSISVAFFICGFLSGRTVERNKAVLELLGIRIGEDIRDIGEDIRDIGEDIKDIRELIGKNNERIEEETKESLKEIGKRFEDIAEDVGGKFEKIGKGLKETEEDLEEELEKIGREIEEGLEKLKDELKKIKTESKERLRKIEDRLKKIRRSLENLKKIRESAEEKLKEIKNEIKKIEEDLEEKLARLKEIEEKFYRIMEIEKELKELESDKNKLEKSIKDLKETEEVKEESEVTGGMKKLVRIEEIVKKLEKLKKDLRERIEEENEEIKERFGVFKEMKDVREIIKEMENLEKHRDDLEERIRETEEKLERIRETEEKLEEKLDKGRLEGWIKEIMTKIKKVEGKSTKISLSERNKGEIEKIIEKIREFIENLEKSRKGLIRELRDHINIFLVNFPTAISGYILLHTILPDVIEKISSPAISQNPLEFILPTLTIVNDKLPIFLFLPLYLLLYKTISTILRLIYKKTYTYIERASSVAPDEIRRESVVNLFDRLTRLVTITGITLHFINRIGLYDKIIEVISPISYALKIAIAVPLALWILVIILDPFFENETIEVGSDKGIVKKVGLLFTKVETMTGEKVYFPNAELLARTVKRHNARGAIHGISKGNIQYKTGEKADEEWIVIHFSCTLGYEYNPDTIEEIFNNLFKEEERRSLENRLREIGYRKALKDVEYIFEERTRPFVSIEDFKDHGIFYRFNFRMKNSLYAPLFRSYFMKRFKEEMDKVEGHIATPLKFEITDIKDSKFFKA